MTHRLKSVSLPFPKSSDGLTQEEALANLRHIAKTTRTRLMEIEGHDDKLPARLRGEAVRNRKLLDRTCRLIADIEATRAQRVFH